MNVSRNNNVDEKGSDSKPFVPSLEITAGQPEPIAANGGWSYMAGIMMVMQALQQQLWTL